ncbi:MAG: uncharacterized membrane protein YqaE (UPF0057 family), partial [Kiritimatiellia bacterium]
NGDFCELNSLNYLSHFITASSGVLSSGVGKDLIINMLLCLLFSFILALFTLSG